MRGRSGAGQKAKGRTRCRESRHACQHVSGATCQVTAMGLECAVSWGFDQSGTKGHKDPFCASHEQDGIALTEAKAL